MKKHLSIFLLVTLTLTTIAIGPVSAITLGNPGVLVMDCTGFNGWTVTFTPDRDNTGAGEEAYHYEAWDGAGTTLFYFASARAIGVTIPLGLSIWASAPAYNPLTLVLVSEAGNGFAEQVVYTWTGECAGLPYKDNGPGNWRPRTVLRPGCDATIQIPDTAVVGSFVENAQVYGVPGQPIEMVMEAGKTAWVFGVDESGAYYKVMLSCQFFWIEVAKMGPNFDEVWNGTPLPTDVVD